jgi:hypothetical protein
MTEEIVGVKVLRAAPAPSAPEPRYLATLAR